MKSYSLSIHQIAVIFFLLLSYFNNINPYLIFTDYIVDAHPNTSITSGESSSRSSERGANAGGGWNGWGVKSGEWRGRRERRDARPRHRIAPERYLNAAYPFQVKFTPDELLNGEIFLVYTSCNLHVVKSTKTPKRF